MTLKLTSLGLYRINSDYQVTTHRVNKGESYLHTDVYKLVLAFIEEAMKDPKVSKIEIDRSAFGNALGITLTRANGAFEVARDEESEEVTNDD